MGWSTSSIRLLGDRILVRLHRRIERHGRIIIADGILGRDLQRQPQSADVWGTGPGLWHPNGFRVPLDVQPGTDDRPGDVIVLGKWNGIALADPDDQPDSSAPNDPRWYVLESGAQKLRRSGNTMPLELDDFYFVVPGAQWGEPVCEWRPSAEAAE